MKILVNPFTGESLVENHPGGHGKKRSFTADTGDGARTYSSAADYSKLLGFSGSAGQLTDLIQKSKDDPTGSKVHAIGDMPVKNWTKSEQGNLKDKSHKAEAKAYKKGLSRRERELVSAAGESRKGSSNTELDQLLAKTPNYEGVVYRGMRSDVKLKVGDVSSIDRPTSSSRSPLIASTFSDGGGTFMKVNTKSGVDIKPVSSSYQGQNEVILKVAKYKVTKVSEKVHYAEPSPQRDASGKIAAIRRRVMTVTVVEMDEI